MQLTHVTIPTGYSALLELAKRSDCLSWFRDTKTLSLILDNIALDRRVCIEVRVERNRLSFKTLNGYDPVKHRWSNYCGPEGEVTFPTKRGLKDLLAWLAERAVEKMGYPNPTSLSLYGLSAGKPSAMAAA